MSDRKPNDREPDTGKTLFQQLGTFWTAANVLSMARMVLALPIAYLIAVEAPLTWVLGLIFFAVLTDWLDGTLARWSHTVSEWGKVLDPVADKVAAASVVTALVVRGSLPAWFLALIVGRDLVIVLGSAVAVRNTGRVLMSVWAGKVAVFVLSLTVLAAILRADAPVQQFLIWASTALLIWSFVLYLVRFVHVLRVRRGALPRDVFEDGKEIGDVSYASPVESGLGGSAGYSVQSGRDLG